MKIVTRKTVETLSEDLTDVTDMKQVFNIVKAAQDGSQIWIIVASDILINQSFSKLAAALAQTKVCLIFLFSSILRIAKMNKLRRSASWSVTFIRVIRERVVTRKYFKTLAYWGASFHYNWFMVLFKIFIFDFS